MFTVSKESVLIKVRLLVDHKDIDFFLIQSVCNTAQDFRMKIRRKKPSISHPAKNTYDRSVFADWANGTCLYFVHFVLTKLCDVS